MSFWKLVTHLWPFSHTKADRGRVVYRVATLEPDEFEDQTAGSALYYAAAAPDNTQTAEIVQISTQLRQYDSTQSRFRRLSVVVVDYLLEHEWFWLLTGRHWPQPQTNAMRAALDAHPTITTTNPSASASDAGRTICVSDSQWSVASTDHATTTGFDDE